MKKLQPVRGTKDILEEEYRQIVLIVTYWHYLVSAYGFKMIQTPIIEDSEVFKKTLGMTSDIIKKETYTFKDRSNNEITLRPEGTAPFVRLFINNKLHHTLPQKLSYQGEMFRYDRPQKGRLREFYQLGVEIIGEKDISADLELIQMAKQFINAVGISDTKFKIHVNSLGDEESRKKYKLALVAYLNDYKKKYPAHKILLTYFSPSGYEIRKNYKDADWIFYLPADTKSNAKKFIEIVNPNKVFFIKYEFWFNYMTELNKKNIPLYFNNMKIDRGNYKRCSTIL